MNQQRTRFDRFIFRIKNNPIIAFLIVLGTIVIALSTFTNATKNLLSLITNPAIIDATGKWATQELTNPFYENDKFRLHFDLEVKGDTLLGAIRQTSMTSRYDVKNGILDGKIKSNIISFYTLEQSDGTTYKNFYYGSVLKDEIEFTLQSDRPWGFPPQKFIAKRE
jgi:hypothetical protein